ncbi:MAG: hypothetical protein RLZZ273_663 [Bacteroidota bacterium]|jgi:DNA-damage-inducible protein D
MKTEVIYSLTKTFEEFAQRTESGVEFWLARDLQHLLGYTKWDNFVSVVAKAKTACEVSGYHVVHHFADVGKTILMPKGATKEVPDVMLTRYACYLIAQNGDPRKAEIAFAQTYFAVQTRRVEFIEQRILDAERVMVRKKLSATEKELSAVIFEQTGSIEDFALIRSKGDMALFNQSTQRIKAQWNVPDNRPLADFAPTIILKAKDFATEITIFNARIHNMSTGQAIATEHVTNNRAVRNTMLERGIRPEALPASEDIKKVARRLSIEDKKSLKNPDGLPPEASED